jgi:hypothetical protein
LGSCFIGFPGTDYRSPATRKRESVPVRLPQEHVPRAITDGAAAARPGVVAIRELYREGSAVADVHPQSQKAAFESGLLVIDERGAGVERAVIADHLDVTRSEGESVPQVVAVWHLSHEFQSRAILGGQSRKKIGVKKLVSNLDL